MHISFWNPMFVGKSSNSNLKSSLKTFAFYSDKTVMPLSHLTKLIIIHL